MNSALIKEFLVKVELFDTFDETELNLVANSMKLKEVEKDTLLFSENTPRNHVYMIFEGEVELFQRTPFGQEKRLAFFSKYDFLGEGSLIDDSPHSTSARALLDTKVISIKCAQLKDLMVENGALAIKLYSKISQVISRRLRRTNTRATNIGAQYESGRTRKEHDLLGERNVPEGKYYGIQTLRAIENFNISGQAINTFPNILEALGIVKMAAAKANYDLGLLSKPVADAIIEACNEIINGKLHTSFVVDMIQGGAGTSTNMNANEVIANRALELL
ncbi:MAG: lyase family protein, partial [Melioribacteraceae bacterium]|nr:lyase family protein [Melioribacteraceae bacterium]